MSRHDVAHPVVESLAAYAAGDLPADEAAAVRDHLRGCSSCTEDIAGLRRAQAQLAAAPAPTMPADVVARLEGALRAERGRAQPVGLPTPPDPAALARSGDVTVLPLSGRPRSARFAPLAAAAAVIGLVAAVGVGALRDRGTPGGAAAGGAGARAQMQQSADAALAPQYESGFRYDAASLRRHVPKLLAGKARRVPELSAAAAGTTDSMAASPESRPPDPRTSMALASPLRDPATLQRCVDALSGTPGTPALAVDHAPYAGRPAAVVVLPTLAGGQRRPDRVDVYVVGTGCRPGDEQVRYFERVRLPEK